LGHFAFLPNNYALSVHLPLPSPPPTQHCSLRTGSQQGRKKILASVKQKNLESKATGAGTGEPVDFVFDAPIRPW